MGQYKVMGVSRDEKITFNRDKKFDLQLARGSAAERRLAAILECDKIERIELKTENWLWERTGNLCVEYQWNGKPSGITATEADYWFHALERDGKLLGYFAFPVDNLWRLVVGAQLDGRVRIGGDDNLSKVALIKICDLLRP